MFKKIISIIWTILAVIFLIWLFLFLKSSSNYIYTYERVIPIHISVNKITGEVKYYVLGKWESSKIANKKKNNQKENNKFEWVDKILKELKNKKK